MLTKAKIALSTLLTVGFASAGLANGTPESRIGDRYPFIKQAAQQPAGASDFASALNRHPAKGFTAAEKTLFERPLGSW